MSNLKTYYFIINLLLLLVVSSCAKEEALPINVDFEIVVVNNDFSTPVEVRITNLTKGAESYQWSFEGGTPSSSTERNPSSAITYNHAGNYIIKLDASNEDDSFGNKEIPISIVSGIEIGFDVEIIESNFSPMEVIITNTSVGATSYQWSFQNANIASSTEENPTNVIFTESGEHTITFAITNGVETLELEKVVEVAPQLEVNFDYEVNFEDDDLQVPVTIQLQNNCISATNYLWTFTGGIPETSTEENPTVTFNNEGTYTLSLEATNGKQTETFTQEITVAANTNIHSFQDIQLGINTAHNNNVIGAFFSTKTREVYTKNQVNDENGAEIDIVFFGFNQNFTSNKFYAPDQIQTTTFDEIPNATHTKFINVLEDCNCTASMSVAEFDAIENDNFFTTLTIEETSEGLQEFDNSLVPRIVLFQTEDNRKGAIKIKEFVEDGQNSYIIIDLKVQKEAN